MGPPSPAAESPFALSFSTGPQPLVIEDQVMSLKYRVVIGVLFEVVKLQTLSAAIALPARSFTPEDAPLIVAV